MKYNFELEDEEYSKVFKLSRTEDKENELNCQDEVRVISSKGDK